MGRQAYLDKIAFGRSAFESTQSTSQSSEYMQLESSQSEIPHRYHEATANNYVQLYDERGNPINPRSHDYGKKLRGAQNDVLASVGVVERRSSPAEGLPGSTKDRFELLEAEDTVGSAISVATTLTERVSIWWIGLIRERLLTFRYHNALSFGQIVASECAISGPSLVYAGFASRAIATLNMQGILHSVSYCQPLERLFRATRASRRTRELLKQPSKLLKYGLRLGLELCFYPFFYHATLQRLGLVPARPLLPSWGSLVPFSRMSPLLPFSIHHDPSASVADCLRACLTSPAVLFCVQHVFEHWLYTCLSEAVSSSVIRPDKPDLPGRTADDKQRALTLDGSQGASPPMLRKAINEFLSLLDWASPLASPISERQRAIRSAQSLDQHDDQTMHVGNTRLTNISPLDLPVAQTQGPAMVDPSGPEVITIPLDALEEMIQSTTPPASAISGSDHGDNDPRIRITSREGIVEMEVRLPQRVLSTHTEMADAFDGPMHLRAAGSRNEAGSLEGGPYHRVTCLSLEPAEMLSEMVGAQLVRLAVLPMKIVTLRVIASHYLASQGRYAKPLRIVSSLGLSSDLDWQSVGMQVSRVALCDTLELGIDLALWGLQYVAVTALGKSMFGWGTL